MASYSSIARPYANALFTLGSEAGCLPALQTLLQVLSQAVSHDWVQKHLTDPVMTTEIWQQHLMTICQSIAPNALQAAAETFTHFLQLTVRSNRLAVLPDISKAFSQMCASALGSVSLTMTTATALTADEQSTIQSTLSQRSGGHAEVTFEVDAGILGGAILRRGDWVVTDGSVMGRLKRVASALLNGTTIGG